MIYLVSSRLFPDNSKYKVISVEESLKLLEPLTIVGLDTETEGFDVFTKELLLVQLGCNEFQVVIDCTTVDIRLYKSYLESQRLFLLWNAKFDLRFFFHKGIVITNVYDGYLAEKLLYLGFPPGIHGLGLKDAGINYLGVELDKSVRGRIHYVGLEDDVIVYAAHDVKYLEQIREKQLEKLRQQGLDIAIQYENRFVVVLAYIEYCGVKLDVPRWRAKMDRDLQIMKEKENTLNQWVVEHFPNDKRFTFLDTQGDLFEGFQTEPKCIINWNSSKQVAALLKELGFEIMVFDKESGQMKGSVEAKVIEPQIEKSSIAPIYLEFKAAQKVVSTYGQNFIDQINIDGRIHTNFSQLMNTGRISCGGKNKQTDEEYVNLQNIPADTETRACFIAEPGNLWISADYQSQESRLIASISGDEAMIDLFNNGCGDVHSLVAKMAYPSIIGDCPVEEVKKKFKHIRGEAKGVEFAINYGGTAETISQNKGIPIEEAREIYDNYMKGFPGVKRYQDFCRKDVMEKGYILLNPKTGHKTYIYNYDKLMEIKKRIFSPDWNWDEYRQLKIDNPSDEKVQIVRKYFKDKSNAEKHSINYRIQGTGALCFKLASILLFKYLKDNNLLFKVKFCIFVHDELDIEAPESIAQEVANELVKCMTKAGNYFCEKVELGADVEVGKYWIH